MRLECLPAYPSVCLSVSLPALVPRQHDFLGVANEFATAIVPIAALAFLAQVREEVLTAYTAWLGVRVRFRVRTSVRLGGGLRHDRPFQR